MKRDDTGGVIRRGKIVEVVRAIVDAIETTGCTAAEEAAAVGAFAELIAIRVEPSLFEAIELARQETLAVLGSMGDH